jgi:hypothetical protein
MGGSQIRCYVAVAPGSGREVRFTGDPDANVVWVKVDDRTVRFELTDTPVVGGAFSAEPARDNYL